MRRLLCILALALVAITAACEDDSEYQACMSNCVTAMVTVDKQECVTLCGQVWGQR